MASSSVTKSTSATRSKSGMAAAWLAMLLMTALSLFLLIFSYDAHPRYYGGFFLAVILIAGMVNYVGKD